MFKRWKQKRIEQARRQAWEESMLRELLNIHYHLDRLETFFALAYHIKEDSKGVWIEDGKVIDKNLIHNKPEENLEEVKT